MKKSNKIIVALLVIVAILVLLLWTFKIISVKFATTSLILDGACIYAFLTVNNYKDSIYGGKFKDHFKNPNNQDEQ